MGETFPPHGGNPVFKNRQIRKSFLKFQPPPPPLHPIIPFPIQLLPNAFPSCFSKSKLPPLWIVRVNSTLAARSIYSEGGWGCRGMGGGGGGLLTCTSSGLRPPLDPGLVFLILSFQQFHPWVIKHVCRGLCTALSLCLKRHPIVLNGDHFKDLEQCLLWLSSAILYPM